MRRLNRPFPSGRCQSVFPLRAILLRHPLQTHLSRYWWPLPVGGLYSNKHPLPSVLDPQGIPPYLG